MSSLEESVPAISPYSSSVRNGPPRFSVMYPTCTRTTSAHSVIEEYIDKGFASCTHILRCSLRYAGCQLDYPAKLATIVKLYASERLFPLGHLGANDWEKIYIIWLAHRCGWEYEAINLLASMMTHLTLWMRDQQMLSQFARHPVPILVPGMSSALLSVLISR